MRHIPIAEFKDKVSEIVSAAEAGEEIVITRHGRAAVKLVSATEDRLARQRAAVHRALAFRQDVLLASGPTSGAEIRQWIEEERR